jgi:predicted RNA binding protein YcfA (HicA-like mRNA interferase family)
VQRGAKVLACGGAASEAEKGGSLSHAAFRNPDGGYVVVVANHGEARPVQVQVGSNALEFNAAADSVHTLEWA